MSLSFLTAAACHDLDYASDPERISYCESAVRSFARHLHNPDLPQIPMGCDAHTYKRAKRARLAALKKLMAADVATDHGLDTKETVGLIAGILLLIFGGPLFVVCAVVAAVAEWSLEGWLDKKFPPKVYEDAAAEVAAADASVNGVDLVMKSLQSTQHSEWVHFCIWCGWLRHGIFHG